MQTMSTQDISRRRAWVMASRPQTLPAAAAPVVVGTAVAVHADLFAPLPAFAALVGALLIQVGTNFANDYYDAVQGADTDAREGFTRVTAGGLIDAEEVKRAMIATYGLAVVIGVYLVAVGGLPIVVVGLSGIAAGVLYTGGPFPYGTAVSATCSSDTRSRRWTPSRSSRRRRVVSSRSARSRRGRSRTSCPHGFSTRSGCDAEARREHHPRPRTDRAAGQQTLAVYLGYGWSRVELLLMVGMAYVVPVVFALDSRSGWRHWPRS